MSVTSPPAPTPREIEILRAMLTHGTRDEAARALFVSPRTVKRHLENLRDKWGVHCTAQLVDIARRQGWLD
jgi:DNA-binding NarL/FixJ family response regulator